jgi:hypothetical protein
VASQADRPTGLIVSDDSGNFYYLRPELLADAKMPEEDVKKLKAGLEQASKTSQDPEINIVELDTVTGGLNLTGVRESKNVEDRRAVRSTIMCPW